MADPVLVTKDNDITTILLYRPEVGNRQSDATWAQVTQMFDDAAKSSRLIIFKAAGDDFCLGRDSMGAPARKARELTRRKGARRYRSSGQAC